MKMTHLLISFLLSLLLASVVQNEETELDKSTKPEDAHAKIPLPEVTAKLDLHFCMNHDDNKTLASVGKCTPKAVVGGTKSPCPPHCMTKHRVQAGDPCDPFLYRFARRMYDDAKEYDKDWMGAKSGSKGIIGRRFLKIDEDFQYKDGLCDFVCPRVLCMGIETTDFVGPYRGEMFVDLYKWDCVSTSLLDKYKGVCTCGYLWSLVDPANTLWRLDNETLLVRYSRTIGLNRRLAWDKKRQRCAAQRYGHCSLGWDPSHSENITYCLDPEKFICVNRSASFLGVAYRPFQVNKTRLWYGICDSQVLIEDPFAKGTRVEGHQGMILGISLLQLLTLNKIFQVL